MAVDISKSIVNVLGQQGIGTGVVIADNIILTCEHVVGKADSQPEVVFSANGEKRPVRNIPLYSPQEEDDIAVLQFDGTLPESVLPLKFGQSVGSKGHPCETFGYPYIPPFEGLAANGIIQLAVKDIRGRQFLQISATGITHGHSGAPLLDERTGRVVGMIVWAAVQEWEHIEETIKAAIDKRKPKVAAGVIPDTAFAIPAETLHR